MASIFKYTKTQIEPFFCWKNKDVCKTTLIYKTDKGDTFRIISDYKSGKRRLEKIGKNKVKELATVDKNIDPYLKEHFGFDDKKVFENTAFIRQSQMAILEDNSVRNKMKDMIEEVFAGRSEASATKALSKIKKIAKDSSKEIDTLEAEQREFKEKLKSAEETKEKLTSDAEFHNKVSEDLDNKSERLIKLKESYKKFQEKEECISLIKVLTDKINKVDKILLGIKENIKKRDSILERKEKFVGYDSLSENNALEIKNLIKKVDECETTFNTLKKSGSRKKVVEEKLNLPYVVLFVIGLVSSVLIIGIPLAFYAYRRMKTKEEREITDEAKEKEIQELKGNLSTLNKELSDKTKKIKGFDRETFVDQFAKYSKLSDVEKNLSESIAELIKAELEHNEIKKDEEANVRNIESKKASLLNDFTVEQNNLKKYKLVSFRQEDFDDLEKLEKEVEKLKEKHTELKTSIRTTTSLVQSPEEIKEQLNIIEEKIINLNKKIDEHGIVIKFLEIAETRVHHKFTPAIEKNSKPILKEITNERYSDLKIEEESLDIKVKAPEIKDYVDIFFLSQGARDQLYFTLRIVMSDLLGGNTNIPLILDDPFHNFDESRLKKTITAIKQISKNKQIILISHRPYHQEFKNLDASVVELK